jgi:uncharacterized membrane protein YbhN (UPF0104 family)
MAQAQKRRPASNWAPVEAPPPKPSTLFDRVIDGITRHRSALRRLGIAASVIIIAGALTIFLRMLVRIDPNKVKAAIASTSGDQFMLAFAFTALSYLALTGYDGLALRHLGIKIPYRLAALASFTSYAFSFTLGFPLVTGAAVRYWIYGPAGLSAGKIASLTIVAGITFWLGLGLVVGSGFLAASDPIADIDHFHPLANRLIGLGVIGALIAYLVWITRMRWRRAAVVGSFKLPGPKLTLGQMALGIASHAPGGIGVFEATILQGVGGDGDDVLASLLLFRGIYYAVPFIAALTMLGGVEAVRRWRSLREAISSASDG